VAAKMPSKPADAREASELARLVGVRVRALRAGAGLTQMQAAERLEMTGEAYARIERGSSLPTCLTLMRIARTFGVTPDALLLEDPPAASSRVRGATEPISEERARRLWAVLRQLEPGRVQLIEQILHAIGSPRSVRN
jgi:transcriptional regulator with XRE-family HTH domain